ncbi:hypothetical protein VNI00_004905 [Paramarasmius palmivorus]|uniref:Palmitoyl-protein thioesterase 1 n=1 Tax=Paramarasmius palmivorus TaxID=297713 RepID=A0AAW0DHY5_9AGAR
MLDFADMIKEVHPGIFIHSVYIEEDLDKDRQAGFYGNVNSQLEGVAEQLAAIPQLKEGFDAIGFSQGENGLLPLGSISTRRYLGGQFFRAYVERYNSPPIHNLITFGSQHMGVSDIGKCKPYDVLCQVARRATKAAVYSDWAQENLVQAQYFRDPAQLPKYLESNKFLTSINNEIPETRNETYAQNLASLDNLVLVLFTSDITVVPKESAWFGSEVIEDDELEYQDAAHQEVFSSGVRKTDRVTLPMHLQPLYTEDWIGLRKLDERGGVVFDICEGAHMQIGECWERLVRQWTGRLI